MHMSLVACSGRLSSFIRLECVHLPFFTQHLHVIQHPFAKCSYRLGMKNITSRFLQSLRLTFLLFLMSSAAHAQFDNGSLVGTIRDQSGGLVANATVSANNTATNNTTTTTTTSAGDYEIPALHVGVYT